MFSTSLRRQEKLRWTLGAAIGISAVGSLAFVFWVAAREPSFKAIQKAAAGKRWSEVENGLRRWLRSHPQDGDAWEMLGGLLFEQDRTQAAREALNRVR